MLEEFSGKLHPADVQDTLTLVAEKNASKGALKDVVSVQTHSLEDIKRTIEWANKTKVAIRPRSSTGNGRFSSDYSLPERTVLIDTSPMNSFKHIDARDKIAIAQPGVSFGKVDEMLKPFDLRAFRPLMPRSGKSVMASYLDREPLINPFDHWDVVDPFGGTCIVLGNGDIQYTGTAAATETSLEDQLKKGHRQMVAPGPVATELSRVLQGAQGTLGIMAWAAIYCERIPKVERSWFASSDKLDDVLALGRDMLHRRNGSTLFIVDNTQLALMTSSNIEQFESRRKTLPKWILFISLSGATHKPEQKVAWQSKALAECAKLYSVNLQEEIADLAADEFAISLRQTSEQDFRKTVFDAYKDVFFLQPFSKIAQTHDVANAHHKNSSFSEKPIGTYIQPMMQGTFCHVEYTFPYSLKEDCSHEHVATFWSSLIASLDSKGVFFSRPYGDWRQRAFENKQGAEYMMSMTKQLLDPNGIMNPNCFPYVGVDQ